MLKQMYDYGIGKTPLFELPKIGSNRIFLKQESRNHLKSVKARTAYGIIKRLEVPKDRIIVESTSGNLGLALDFFCREDGRQFLCLLDETVIEAKRRHLESCGVECRIVPIFDGMDGRSSRIKFAQQLMEDKGYHWVNQYDNEAGVAIHRETTGAEIYEQTGGEVTCVICALGSGGTAVGIGEYFRSKGMKVNLVGVEPCGSTIFHAQDASYIPAGAGLRGKPGNIRKHPKAITQPFAISDAETLDKFRKLNCIYHADAGITTGMNYAAALKYCETAEHETIVILSADGMDMYSDYL